MSQKENGKLHTLRFCGCHNMDHYANSDFSPANSAVYDEAIASNSDLLGGQFNFDNEQRFPPMHNTRQFPLSEPAMVDKESEAQPWNQNAASFSIFPSLPGASVDRNRCSSSTFNAFVSQAQEAENSWKYGGTQEPFTSFPTGFTSFRPLNPDYASWNASGSVARNRIRNVPIPSLLNGEVDPSQYEHVDWEDYAMADHVYGRSSPMTGVSETNSPTNSQLIDDVVHQDIVPAYHQQSHWNNRGAFSTTSSFNSDNKTNPSHGPLPQASYEAHWAAYGGPSYAQPFNSIHTEQTLLASPSCDCSTDPRMSVSFSSQILPSSHEADTAANKNSSHLISKEEPSTTPDARKKAIDERQRRDEYLLQLRRRGYRYKDIKRIGGFHEAESTLRGRIRSLTKSKHERVRRPEWTAKDVRLLREATRKFDKSQTELPRGQSAKRRRRYPWKEIGKWMMENGATYPFAPATCARKWEDLAQR